ncbi:uronyl 2-sulfotransferase-like [Diadema setosum]|uniref:uronyl 2-sulfotransferase-like n=1 Tax=Diadema setosum TaxID=31175 RepID=UPI003B3BDEB3
MPSSKVSSFIKLQLMALCCLAVWLLITSSPSSDPKNNHSLSYFLLSVAKKRYIYNRTRTTFISNRNWKQTLDNLSLVQDSQGNISTLEQQPSSKLSSASLLPSNEAGGNNEQGEDPDWRSKKHWQIKWYDKYFDHPPQLPASVGTGHFHSSEKDHVIFNRVGKCGSRSILELLHTLAARNHFFLICSQTFNDKHITTSEEEKLVSILREVDAPYMYQRHLHFVNFTRYGAPRPKYINIIRDPLQRAVSQYYFIRYGDEMKNERKFSANSTDPARVMSYEECVLQKKTECVGRKSFYIIPFFCGLDPKCRISSEWAYLRAKRNVVENYVVVGVLEELENSLQVMEKVLPNFFSGALQTHLTSKQKEMVNKSMKGVTKFKQQPSEKTALFVKTTLMKYEYKFYNWIRDRLHQQMQDLGLHPYHSDFR